MAPPSIAIIGSRGIPAEYGGFETFAEELSVRLVEHGVDVTVFCEGVTGPASHRGVRLEYVPTPHLGGLTTIIHDMRALWRARKKYDVVYMLGYGTSVFCLLPKLAGAEVWMNMDGVEWQRNKWGVFGKTWWKLMEACSQYVPHLMIADANAIRDFLQKRHSKLPEIRVISYGATCIDAPPDVSALEEWGLKPNEFHLLVSRFEPENHVREIFEGYAKSKSPYPMVALGTTRKPTAYTRLLDEIAKEDDRFVLPGPIYDERIAALRYYARTYLHGHSVGGTNPSLLEAMGSGSAIIAHGNVFNREVIGEAAEFFSSAQDVTARLEALDADNLRRSILGALARERVEAAYSWDYVVDAYLELLKVPMRRTLPTNGDGFAEVDVVNGQLHSASVSS